MTRTTRALRAPLGGRPLEVRSADGTRLHAEAFGPEDGATDRAGARLDRAAALLGARDHAADRAWAAAGGLRPARSRRTAGPRPDDDYALERFGEDLEAVLAAATPAGERATVAGHSLGAMSIAAWAEHHDVAARADAAALINTGLGDLITGHLLYGGTRQAAGQPHSRRLLARLAARRCPVLLAASARGDPLRRVRPGRHLRRRWRSTSACSWPALQTCAPPPGSRCRTWTCGTRWHA